MKYLLAYCVFQRISTAANEIWTENSPSQGPRQELRKPDLDRGVWERFPGGEWIMDPSRVFDRFCIHLGRSDSE